MKVVMIARSKNEALNIGRFCNAYRDCVDMILLADGGSEDNTVDIAKGFKNVQVRHFKERMEFPGGVWRNPHGKHMNFLIDWALEEDPDWIIFDDIDCIPTEALRLNLREIMANADHPSIWLYRLYVWGKDQYFPKLNEPGKSIYAWKPELGIVAQNEPPLACVLLNVPSDTKGVILEPPFCIMHYFCQTEELAQAKLEFYRATGEQTGIQHPSKFGGPLEYLPDWAHE